MSPALGAAATAALTLSAWWLVRRDLVRARLRRLDATETPATPLASCPGVIRAATLRALSARTARQRRDQLAPALDTIASALRAGRSMPEAVTDAGSVGPPLGPEFVEIGESARRGAPLVEVLEAWAADADPDTRSVAAALAVGSSVGGPVARAVDSAAQSLRERQALQREAAALATQAKASAVVLSLAPGVVVVILGIADPATVQFFTTTRIGQLCVLAGVGLDLAGAAWMRRMVRLAVDPPRVEAA